MATTWRALLTTGEMIDQQIRMLYPGGAYRWTRARCVPVRDAQGNIVRYVTFQIDVDDLKRAEDLLAAEVKLLERVARGEPLAPGSGRPQPSRGRTLQRLLLQYPPRCAGQPALRDRRGPEPTGRFQ